MFNLFFKIKFHFCQTTSLTRLYKNLLSAGTIVHSASQLHLGYLHFNLFSPTYIIIKSFSSNDV